MKNIDLTLPASWDDLNETQLSGLAKLLFYPVKRASFDLGVLLILLDCKWWQFKKFRRARMLVLNHRFEDIKKHYSFVYEKTDLKKFVSRVELRSGSPGLPITYMGPKDFLLNITAYEFSVADDMYLRFKNEKNVLKRLEYAQYLAAVLYKPKIPPFLIL